MTILTGERASAFNVVLDMAEASNGPIVSPCPRVAEGDDVKIDGLGLFISRSDRSSTLYQSSTLNSTVLSVLRELCR